MKISKKQKQHLKSNDRSIKLNPEEKKRVILEFKRILVGDKKISEELGIKIKRGILSGK